jgi:membrane-bound metal-dependent hydrolase YbcI (DUF457 family)
VITPTHIITALALLSKRDAPGRNWAVLAGAVMPDLAIYIWAPWQRWIAGQDWPVIWDILYFEPPMQTATALTNSLPLYLLLALIGYIYRARLWGQLWFVFALAAVIHIALDLPVHSSDAYRHFWPISDWRFMSPVSYWEVDKGAPWVSLIDFALVMISGLLLWRRFPKWWVKIAVTLTALFSLGFALAYQFATIQVPS